MSRIVDFDAVFEAERPRLVGLAYGMLGQIADAEDVVQDAYLRWHAADRTGVREPPAFLTTIVTRLAIDRLRVLKRERETYVGPWLPDPVIADTDVAERVLGADRIGYALLATLERLNPMERAVLLLRDVFDYEYTEIAAMVEKTVDNCRQIAVRARERVGNARVRVRPTKREARRLQWAFARAVQRGEIDRIAALLAADAVLYSDGGANAPAARKPIYGARNVAKLWVGLRRKAPPEVTASFITVNGEPGFRTDFPDGRHSFVVFEIDRGTIRAIRMVVSPEKLDLLGPPQPRVFERVALSVIAVLGGRRRRKGA